MTATRCATPGCRRDYAVIVACAPDGFLCRPCADALESRREPGSPELEPELERVLLRALELVEDAIPRDGWFEVSDERLLALARAVERAHDAARAEADLPDRSD